jgi:DNA processing protein
MITQAWLSLNAATAWIGPVRFHRLLAAFGSPEAVLGKNASTLASRVPGLQLAQAEALLKFASAFNAAAEESLIKELAVQVYRFDEPGYPSRLKELPNPAPLLYVRGTLPPEGALCVALVGTRKATDYGLRQARTLSQDLAKAGVWIISGLAAGIDAAAHQACLDAGGHTLAVQGRGLAGIYPGSNRDLGQRIPLQGGALVSQFSLQAPPLQHHFPMRNALISGFSHGVVVVEGERDSGSLITADRALDQGREVFAVPGPADAPYSQGPLDLLENGARLVRHADDVLKELGLAVPPRGRRSRTVDASVQADLPGLDNPAPAFDASQLPEGSDEARILAVLAARSATLDEIGRQSGLEAGSLAVALTQLELLGAVRQQPGARVELVRA